MNYNQTIILSALDVLQQQNMDFLLVGGVAVNFHGFTRNTIDIDFMMALTDVDGMVKAMKNAGFTSYSIHPMVVFFQKPGNPVRIDFLRIDSETLGRLNRSAVGVQIENHHVKIPSLCDLLAMKLHSFYQSGMDRDKDMIDIVSLCVIHNVDVEAVLYPLAQKYASEEIYQLVYKKIQAKRNKL